MTESDHAAAARFAGLPRLQRDEPAALLVVDLGSRAVTYANPVAAALAGGAPLPIAADAWSHAAGLLDVSGQALADGASPVDRVARGRTVVGEPVAVLADHARRADPDSSGAAPTALDGLRTRTYWVTGFPLPHAAGLAGSALVAFFRLELAAHEPYEAGPAAGAEHGLGSTDLDDLRSRALLASDHAFTIADPRQPDSPLVWVNPAFTRTTGYAFDEVVGRNCRFLQGRDTDPASVAALRRALEAREPVRVELLNYRKDGSAFYNELSISPVFDGQGELTHFVGVQADVTARVLAGLERDELLAAEREARRTAELAGARLTLLSEVSALLSGSVQAAELEAALLEIARALVPGEADWCAIDLLDSDPEAWAEGRPLRSRRVAAWHRDESKMPLIHRLDQLDQTAGDTSSASQVLLAGGSVLREELPPDFAEQRAGGDPDRLAVLQALGVVSGIGVPLIARGAVLGTLVLSATAESGRRYGPADLRFAEDLAGRIGVLLDNARLHLAEAAERRRAALLAEASVALSASLDPTEVLDRLLTFLVPSLGELAVVHMPDPNGELRPVASRHRDSGRAVQDRADLAHLRVRPDDPGPGTAHASGSPQLVSVIGNALLEQVAAGDADRLATLRRLGFTSAVSVPLLARGRSVGVVSVTRREGPPPGRADLELVTDLATRGGLAWDNARLYDAERSTAQELQLALLPDNLPDLAGLSFASRYLPGTAGTQVGGDWYDVIRLPGGRAGIAVGDVMGRGLRAAAVMGQLRSALRSYAVEGLPPAEVLRRLDEFTSLIEGQDLVTCAYGVWDPAARKLTMSTAGHLPPLLVLPGQAPQFLEQDPGLPLGIRSGVPAPLSELEVEVPPGALVLLYTDGLVEGRDVPVGDGMETVAAALAGVPLLSAEHAVDTVFKAMGRDGEHDDDTAVLAILATGDATPVQGEAAPARVVLPPVPESAAAARRFLAEHLHAWGLDRFRDPAELLLSELVTNAVRHARTDVEVQLAADADLLRVSVLDLSPRLPVPADGVDDDAEGGRGLLLLDALAPRWGSELLSTGKRVWFELDAAPADAG